MSDPQHEPTMEEILASIRKIISEDAPETPAGVAPEPEPAYAPTPMAADPDILELTQEVAPAPQPMIYAPEPAKPEHDVIFENIEETNMSASDHNDIFSDHTRKAMDDTFANIPEEPVAAAHAAPAQSPAPLPPMDGASVENVFERAVRESFEPVMRKYLSDNSGSVIDGIKPLIREWMDEHFPALLEGAVRAEVERVVKARGAKR